MSDDQATGTSSEPLFTVAEVEKLTNDDVTAGRAIGKMLSILFLYTVGATILVTMLTYKGCMIDNSAGVAAEQPESTGH
ncbi:MAG: hypothetical protein MK110_13735 [Fuerstiella sp.]|nr:hypothetical protein [Fuerstiella sp.]